LILFVRYVFVIAVFGFNQFIQFSFEEGGAFLVEVLTHLADYLLGGNISIDPK
jgi:hypothetical protein